MSPRISSLISLVPDSWPVLIVLLIAQPAKDINEMDNSRTADRCIFFYPIFQFIEVLEKDRRMVILLFQLIKFR